MYFSAADALFSSFSLPSICSKSVQYCSTGGKPDVDDDDDDDDDDEEATNEGTNGGSEEEG